ncbi:glycosyltransferase family 2 protein [Albibacterium bauzanense]|uniref:Glycosyltransferase 2-like domain-containing protein n=1 Tax=Albibacterium bauzanense TaxID=653929 RepID=A0A4R1M014_9SPHI|nr:glycosyltransferase family 2 protein [Albibacterium bauzanense]TCK84945.1 hypothetical protein C8N28_0241 [Albibacterium bauzanense]
MDVSVIIVSYNTKDLTLQCVNSVLEQTKEVSFEVIIVDNDSKDGTKEYFINDSRITYIQNDSNVGFGIANNIGVNVSKGRYVFLLNSDTILLNNAIKLFYDFMVENETKNTVGVIGTVLLNMDKTEGLSVIHFKSISYLLRLSFRKLIQKIFGLSQAFVDKKLPNKMTFNVDGVMGADMFIPSTVYKKINGFDDSYFMFGEEVDLQKRIKDLGLQRLIIRGPQIIHIHGGSGDNDGRKLSFRSIYSIQKGSIFFIKKNYSSLYYISYKFILLLIWFPWVLIDKRFDAIQRISLFKLIINPSKY